MQMVGRRQPFVPTTWMVKKHCGIKRVSSELAGKTKAPDAPPKVINLVDT